MKTLLGVKTAIAAAAIAATTIVTIVPTPASAIGVFVGPRGGVGVRLGGPRLGYRGGYGYGYRRGFGYRGALGYRHGFYRRGFRRF